ncbi:Spo11/DNA topoisomerase VI subunit A [Fennellomyces sp. T-0311]|nr:Spo11/DNA topoisomerase VI subunit A [Fennellomyces sp. T-0311]
MESTILSLLEKIALGKQLGLPTATPAQPTRGRKALKSSRGGNSKKGRLHRSSFDASLELVKRNNIKKFTRRLRVLQIMHESIVQNVVVSKRDIFYRDVELFETQKVVDDIVTGWSHCFNVPRSTLHVTASSKGLIYGAASITLKNGRKLDCTASVHTDDSFCSDEQGILIPPVNQITHVDSAATFVLIIEKEASFRHLVSTGFARAFPNGILITGRGYPDIATRHLLKYLSIYHEQLPLLAFVDYDPYGLEIYSVYKWGSRAQAFDAPNLAVPKTQHIGLTSKDRLKYNIPDQAFMPMTPRDRRKAVIMTSGRTNMDESSQLVQPEYHLIDQHPSSYRSFM